MREIQKVDNSSKGAGIGNGLVVVVVFFLLSACLCVNLCSLQDRAQQELFSVSQGYNCCPICWASMLCFMVRSSLTS